MNSGQGLWLNIVPSPAREAAPGNSALPTTNASPTPKRISSRRIAAVRAGLRLGIAVAERRLAIGLERVERRRPVGLESGAVRAGLQRLVRARHLDREEARVLDALLPAGD